MSVLIPSARETITIGGAVFTNISNLIHLFTIAAGNLQGTCRKMGSGTGAGYAVTAGKTLKIRAVSFHPTTAANIAVSIAQSDNDIGFNSATALTNPVYFGIESSTQQSIIDSLATVAQVVAFTFAAGNVAAAKYLSVIASANGIRFNAYGYEV